MCVLASQNNRKCQLDSDNNEVFSVDDVLCVIGSFGRYQLFQYLLLCLVSVVAAFQAFNMVFIGDTPAHHCYIPVDASAYNLTEEELIHEAIPADDCADCGDDTTQLNQCRMYNLTELGFQIAAPQSYSKSSNTSHQPSTTPCLYGWDYDQQFYDATIVTEWDLVCSKTWLRGTADTVFFSGRLLGAVVFGKISDRFGRQAGLISAAVPQVLIGILVRISRHYVAFLVLYFLQGMTQVGIMLSSFVWATELVGTSKRKLAAMGHKMAYSVGSMLLACIACLLRDWRSLELAISLPSIFFLTYKCVMPESARWLLSHDRIHEAKIVLYRTAKYNRRLSQVHVIQQLSHVKVKQASVLELLKRYRLAKITLALWTVWLVNQMVYSGLSLNTKSLSGSPYLNFLLIGLAEVPGILLALLLVDRLGRKPCICAGLFLAAICCCVAGFLPAGYDTLETTMVLLGKCSITHSFSTVFLITAEVFPTTFRNVGVGTSAMCGHIGGTVAAVTVALADVYPPLPYIVFAVLSFSGMFLILLVPETLGQPLPQTLDEMEEGHETIATISGGIDNVNYIDSGDFEIPQLDDRR